MDSRAGLLEKIELRDRTIERTKQEATAWRKETRKQYEAFAALIQLYPEQFAAYIHEDDGYAYRLAPGNGVYYDVELLVKDLLEEGDEQKKTKAGEARWQRLFGTQED